MKKVLVLGLALALLVAGTASARGPAEKGTGFIMLYEPWDGGHREVDFNAHEAKDGRPAKGSMVDDVYGPTGLWRRTFMYSVHYVRVEGDYVHFGAYCYYDSNGTHAGRWLYVKAQDGGTPGRAGDGIGWKWGSETAVANWVTFGSTTGWWRMPIAGNLVVHTYE